MTEHAYHFEAFTLTEWTAGRPEFRPACGCGWRGALTADRYTDAAAAAAAHQVTYRRHAA